MNFEKMVPIMLLALVLSTVTVAGATSYSIVRGGNCCCAQPGGKSGEPVIDTIIPAPGDTINPVAGDTIIVVAGDTIKAGTGRNARVLLAPGRSAVIRTRRR